MLMYTIKRGIKMKLNFEITSFYNTRYGRIKEVDDFCERIVKLASLKQYSQKVDIIDFLPIILEKDLIELGKGKEFTKFDLSYRAVAISRQIDFEMFSKSDLDGKQKLLLKCLINGLIDIKSKIKLDLKDFLKDLENELKCKIEI